MGRPWLSRILVKVLEVYAKDIHIPGTLAGLRGYHRFLSRFALRQQIRALRENMDVLVILKPDLCVTLG